MSPDEIHDYRTRLGLTQARLAALLPTSKRNVENWEAKGTAHREPPDYLPRALRDLERELAEAS